MVATQVLISLCVAGLTVAVSEPVNRQVIVTDVVTALQPSIARAVANALSGVGGGNRYAQSSLTTSSNGFASGSRFAGASLSGSGSSTGFASGSQSAGAYSVSGSSGASGAAAEVTARPEYAYKYQVSDDVDQTYISHNEARDGNEVTGAYSYVDSNGDLVTVNYQAGADGFSQTLEKQVGAVEIRAKPAKVASTGYSATGSSTSSGSSFGSSAGSRLGGSSGSTTGSQYRSGSSSGSRYSSSSSSVDQSSLIAQILSALQPQISVAVNSAVSRL